jgi:glycosyltransferase involved in cell wall biosynthesis
MAMTPHRAGKTDWVLTMSPVHRASFLEQYPFLDPAHTIALGGGISTDRIEKLAPEERDPYRLIWTSSPDRGLEIMIDILQRAREFEPRLHLHIHYGWDNCDKAIATDPKHPTARLKAKIMGMDLTNVVWEGRTTKTALYKSYMQSNLWVYPTQFCETFGVSACEAQAMGAIPICPPIWGLGHNVGHGMLIRGRTDDPLVQSHYVMGILRLVRDPQLCTEIRETMCDWALERFDWNRIVDGHESLARECA